MKKLGKFETIYQRACKRKGGQDKLNSLLASTLKTPYKEYPSDDRILSEMTRCVFQAGFSWRVVDKKWPDFEQVFERFDPQILRFLSAEDIDNLSTDTRIIRNRQKINSVRENAQFIYEQSLEHGSFAAMLKQWPANEPLSLFILLKKNGSRLGGMTGPRVLRNIGYDTYLLTTDVISCLLDNGLNISTSPTSLTDLRLVQSSFNNWQNETGFSFSQLSKICSWSIGENFVTAD